MEKQKERVFTWRKCRDGRYPANPEDEGQKAADGWPVDRRPHFTGPVTTGKLFLTVRNWPKIWTGTREPRAVTASRIQRGA